MATFTHQTLLKKKKTKQKKRPEAHQLSSRLTRRTLQTILQQPGRPLFLPVDHGAQVSDKLSSMCMILKELAMS